jgi:hypothetical protein
MVKLVIVEEFAHSSRSPAERILGETVMVFAGRPSRTTNWAE